MTHGRHGKVIGFMCNFHLANIYLFGEQLANKCIAKANKYEMDRNKKSFKQLNLKDLYFK